ncbi:MAG TPA: hypothetical protein VHL85_11920 [Burkholderiales bacterium]|jgi:hypothetical protein|nr:hypothetical protein [Burkholderiales bacterium]
MAALHPLPPQKRHPADYRDDSEHAEIARILSELPERHPARVAYATGAWEGANTLSLSRLVAQRMDLVERLIEVYSAHAAEARPRVPEL